MSEENKDKKTEFKMIQNENILFKHEIDPITGSIKDKIKETN